MSSNNLDKSDYEEPSCLLLDPRTGERKCASSIPMQRIVDKLEEYCTVKDFDGARRHLKYWLSEAQAQGDIRGQFSVQNEMMGFYRKQGEYDEAIASVKEAVCLMEILGNEDTISGATCHVNCGTVYDTFSEPENALMHFTKAEKIFEALAFKDLFRLGSLYNNMALAYMELGRYPEAMDYYAKALDTMEQLAGSELEQAITYLNMADCAALEEGLDIAAGEINGYLEKAKKLIDTDALVRDGYYAFVCEKCSPGFNCYGDFEYAEELDRRAADIYNKAKGSE